MSSELTYSAFESRYRDRKRIGAGGFAQVFKVYDHARNHYVALKMADVRPEYKDFTLRNEVELVNQMPYHRNVARYDACYRFDTGITGEKDFAVMKFYEYGNLEQFLKKEKIYPEDKRMIIQGVLDGIKFLHSHNVIHRDLKSQNILMNREDGVWTPKITDFGLSKKVLEQATITNSSIGISINYAAPEQIMNKKINMNVDLWAIGVIIYRIVADELPFRGSSQGDNSSYNSQLEISKKITAMELPEKLDNLPEPYASVIKRCLVFEPSERAQSAQELIDILRGTSSVAADNTKQAWRPEVTEHKTQILHHDRDIDPPIKEHRRPREKPAVKQNPSPPAFNFQENEYVAPTRNVTQIIQNKTEEKVEEVEKITTFQPKSGEPKGSPIWLWFLIPILLLSGFASWYFYFRQPAMASQTVVLNPNVRQKSILQFGSIEKRILSAKNDHDELNKIILELNAVESDAKNTRNYRPNYLMSMTYCFLNQPGNAIRRLRKSANISSRNSDTVKLLGEINNNEQIFRSLTKMDQGAPWTKIMKVLTKDTE